MSLSIRTLVPTVFLAALLASTSLAGPVLRDSASTCLQIAEREFVLRVDSGIALYEANKDYALEISFGRRCEIQQVRIAPKYAWEHIIPEWTEPKNLISLTADQYGEILARIGRLRTLGDFSQASNDTVYTVSNSKTQNWEQYENAFTWRTEHCCPNDKPRLLFSFVVYFLHRVAGKITAKRWEQSTDAIGIPRIEINHKWYMATKHEFRKARIGKYAALSVAGPI